MKKLIVILILSISLLSVNTAWSKDSKDDFTIDVGISAWMPSISYSPTPANITYTSSTLVGPKVDIEFDRFFLGLKYLFPFTGFNANVTPTASTSLKTSWLSLLLGYMVTQNIGIYASYIDNSSTLNVDLGGSSISQTHSIAGPGLGVIACLPIGKKGLSFYLNGSYSFGSYKDTGLPKSPYTTNVIDVEAGLGYKFLKETLQANLGWRYQDNSITGMTFNGITTSGIAFSGPFANVTYLFKPY
ncbi:MAG: hypothetical protein HQK91_11665 [Nitrospirae bacterium]|nr:hypothetical protein [Nitrospirota bacterium]